MKVKPSRVAVIALFTALGSSVAFAHEVYPSGDSADLHWIEHLNDSKPAQAAAPRGAEGPIRTESSASYCDPAFRPYYSTIGWQSAAESGTCAMNESGGTAKLRRG